MRVTAKWGSLGDIVCDTEAGWRLTGFGSIAFDSSHLQLWPILSNPKKSPLNWSNSCTRHITIIIIWILYTGTTMVMYNHLSIHIKLTFPMDVSNNTFPSPTTNLWRQKSSIARGSQKSNVSFRAKTIPSRGPTYRPRPPRPPTRHTHAVTRARTQRRRKRQGKLENLNLSQIRNLINKGLVDWVHA